MTGLDQPLQQALQREYRALVGLFANIVGISLLIAATGLCAYYFTDRIFPAPWWVAFLIPFSLFFLVHLKSFLRLVRVTWWLFVKPRKVREGEKGQK